MARLLLTPTDRDLGDPIPLGNGTVTIGRSSKNSITLVDDRVSRYHCIIERDDDGQIVVRDLKSRNGTKINDIKIDQAPLSPGDVLRVGRREFVIEALDSPEDAPPAKSRRRRKGAKGEGNGRATPAWAVGLQKTYDQLPPRDEPVPTVHLIDARGEPSEALASSGDGPRAVRILVQLASKSRATDIHLEPKAETVHVRIRVDGQMVSLEELPNRVGSLMNGVVKTACQMQSAAPDTVQEGHFSVAFPDRRVDYRVSFTPSVHGQKLVLRVLDTRGVPHTLADLGLASYMHQRIRRVCDQDHGLLLVCGPTGSGKTTTLYNALREINRESRNVITIEDPVEYQLDNVTQIPIDTGKGNTFGSLLRSVLRQDPDVILLGEIRDEETARTAMQAAMTGHVVFSTIHAKDSIAAVFRLLDLNVEPYLVANSLDLILAQRLVRVLCENCRRSVPVTPGQATRIGRYLGGATNVYAATGCARCLRTGYRGRRAIFELLDFTDELRDVILADPTIHAMKRVIEQGLFTTLVQSGWLMAAKGITSLDEVERVAGIG
jgi:general secretion pathway protein E